MNVVYNKVCEFIKSYPGTLAWRLKKHSKVLEKHLNPDEEVFFAFCGQKTESIWDIFLTCVVAITNKRLILVQKRVLFGYNFISITPDMYNDLTVRQGLIWGTIVIDTIKENIVVTKLSKKSLSRVETEITEYMIREKKKYQTSNINNEIAE